MSVPRNHFSGKDRLQNTNSFCFFSFGWFGILWNGTLLLLAIYDWQPGVWFLPVFRHRRVMQSLPLGVCCWRSRKSGRIYGEVKLAIILLNWTKLWWSSLVLALDSSIRDHYPTCWKLSWFLCLFSNISRAACFSALEGQVGELLGDLSSGTSGRHRGFSVLFCRSLDRKQWFYWCFLVQIWFSRFFGSFLSKS